MEIAKHSSRCRLRQMYNRLWTRVSRIKQYTSAGQVLLKRLTLW